MAYASWSVVFGEQPSAAKWNILGTNDASFNDGTGIAASAITPEKLLTGTGTSWGWSSFTPSWTNLTAGSGTNVGYYKQIGKTVFFKTRFVFGVGSSLNATNPPILTLPVTASSNAMSDQDTKIGDLIILDSGTARFYGTLVYTTTTTSTCIANAANTTYVSPSAIHATAPMTWTTSDSMHISGFYEAA